MSLCRILPAITVRLLFQMTAPLLLGLSMSACAGSVERADAAGAFDYAGLKGRAKALAERPYTEPNLTLPGPLQDLSWDDYQQLAFDADQALWQQTGSHLRAELFHLGLYFKQAIRIYALEEGVAREIAYRPELFEYGKSGIDGDNLPSDLGFAGFRFKFHRDWQRDMVAFLGASYFRAVGADMQYGLSARGLAIDTALNRPEEFPVFTHFWLEKPAPGSDAAVVYALLDSPSATGAYRFAITPGTHTVMDVDVAIYPRKAIERLGVAPLTSMYMIGENHRRAGWDWRPEIHDSDGLAMQTGQGNWLWRPLVNPQALRFSAFSDDNPKGFGLLQRDRNFDHYQDDGVFYDKRPGVWVAPKGPWGRGEVQLVEIPTLDETFDNIVAFWRPAKPIEAGQEWLFSYRLTWGAAPTPEHHYARVQDTFTGLGGVVGKKREYFSKRFVVDFAGGSLAKITADAKSASESAAKVEAKITHSSGRVELVSVRPQRAISGYRAMFDLVPPKGTEPIDLSLQLLVAGQPISETWVYQWTPPPAAERELYNPGHL